MLQMNANGILNVLVQTLRDKRQVLEREIATLNTQQAELTARQHQITGQLRQKSAEHEAITKQKVESFIANWLMLKPHNPFPCPICYCLGRESELTALPGDDQLEPLKCKSCGEVFEIPAD